MNKKLKLERVAREIEKCEVCKSGKSGKAVPGEGNPDAKIMFIGEAPGRNEALIGRPFVGRSGKLLRSMITSIGLREEDIYITSPVKYLPDRGTPTSEDISHGRAHLMKQIEIIKPKIIVLLGRVAAEGVLQRKVTVIKDHGAVIEEKDGKRYFLTLHPAAAIRFQKNEPLLESDFKAIKKLL